MTVLAATCSVACDFCTGAAAVVYPAAPTTTRSRMTDARTDEPVRCSVTFERSDWRACAACNELIASGRRDELVERSLRSHAPRLAPMIGTVPSDRRARLMRELRASLRRLHDDFWKSRLGPPERLGEE